MKTKSLICSVVLVGMVTGCATGVYTPPGATEKVLNEKVVNADFDTTWSTLVEFASGHFFAIDKFEKASGLMTLNFGSTQPELFVNCGKIVVNGSIKFDGSYVEWLSKRTSAKLDGKMNLLVKKVEANKTLVRVNARYSFVVPPSVDAAGNLDRGNSWVFDSEQPATVTVDGAMMGTIPTRTCVATGYAEKKVLDAMH